MLCVKQKSDWEEHGKFSTSADRLTFVRLCFQDYMLRACAMTIPLLVPPSVKRDHSRAPVGFFFKQEDCTRYKIFQCCACRERTSDPAWIKNPHFFDTSTPICFKCCG